MSKQHQVIIETENEALAKYIVNLFQDGTIPEVINKEGEVTNTKDFEVYVDESKNEFKKHKIQL